MLDETDVTELLDNYRECCRHLWNTYFLSCSEGDGDHDSAERFEVVSGLLFDSIVGVRVRRRCGVSLSLVGSSSSCAQIRLRFVHRSSIMVNRETQSPYWDDPVGFVEAEEMDVRLVDVFDWSLTGFREFSVYRGHIRHSAKYPHLIGRQALIPAGSAVRAFVVADSRGRP